jgi:phenylpropionate dioxygenase-like ring-hydroxylating dioxygenase large terminal subunit
MVGELPTLRARASAGLLADNFLDVAHFPFVHAGTFGAEEAAEVPSYAVARDDWSFTVSYEHPFAHRQDPGVAAGLCILASEPGLAAFRVVHPRVQVCCAALDPGLNDNGFIVPGLGYAGDRLFGPPD